MDDLDTKIVAQFRARVEELKAAQVRAKERIEQCRAEQIAWQQHEQQALTELVGISRSIIEIEKVLNTPPPESPKVPETPKESDPQNKKETIS